VVDFGNVSVFRDRATYNNDSDCTSKHVNEVCLWKWSGSCVSCT